MAEDRQALAMQYLQLLQSGVPAAQAFKQVYPNGIPTQQQQLAKDAKAKQGSALAATGGTIAGLLGIKYGNRFLDSLGSDEAKKEVISQIGDKLLEKGGEQVLNQGGNQVIGQATADVTNEGISQLGANGAGNIAGAEAAPTVLGNFGAMGIGPQAGIVAGTALTAKGLHDLATGKKPDPVSRTVTAMSTFGFSELARALGLGQPSTRDIAKQHTKSLLKASNDSNYQNYIQGMRQQYNAPPPDPAHPFAGKYANFDEYKKAGLQANDLTGVYGNLKLGPDYVGLPEELKQAFTQSQIDKGNYESKKGEVQFVNPDAAQQDFNTFKSGLPANKSNAQQVQQQTQQPINPALAKKQLAQTAQFGNQLFQAINNRGAAK